ncbi:DUF697 domain-containing protein [Lactococcus hircilactis]|uniref:DUF697 domain-containing protein n=1 Tax=Lactococcus hircilactis TaxID=1494462 RepID=A0A7X1Z814_9LACT|nr:DUF697 domain-containing protein [Lactococcus hircilactis]MQW39538.1 DUF697 domain-containing protein [Lactococcus hircilactis]
MFHRNKNKGIHLKTKENHERQEQNDHFDTFFSEVTDRMPQKSAQLLKNSFGTLKVQAEKQLATIATQFDHSFDPLLENVDEKQRKKCHEVIHSATLMAAIVTLSPIPLTDSAMLVPIQVVMMGRLHKLFGASWTEGMAWSIAKETFLLTFIREIPGNLMKFIPFFGTAAGSIANVTVSVLTTEALGWITVNMLNKGEDVLGNGKKVSAQVKTALSMIKLTKK